MNKSRKLLEQALELAGNGELDLALQKLGEGIRSAKEDDDRHWLFLLHKNAGVLHEQAGQLTMAKESYELALPYNKSDTYLLYALGDICRRLGENALATKYFESCYTVATDTHDSDLLATLSKSGYGPK